MSAPFLDNNTIYDLNLIADSDNFGNTENTFAESTWNSKFQIPDSFHHCRFL